MENKKNEQKKQINIFLILSIFLTAVCIVLIAAFGFVAVSFKNYKNDFAVNANVSSQTTSSEPDVSSMPIIETIPVDALKLYSEQYNVSAEFLQRFFDDVIVYKSEGGIKYAPIDETLPKSTLNFNNLVQIGGEKQYYVDGVSAGTKVIDVSKHQGAINWKKVKASGVDNAMLRVGIRGYESGKIVLDENFHANIKNATAAGVKIGVYFFSQANTVEEAIEEADFVLEHIKGYELTLPVAIDIEEIADDPEIVRTSSLDSTVRTDIAIAFLEKVKAEGYIPMVYSNIRCYIEGLDMTRLTEYDKWFAQYFDTPFFPYDLQMWQYTGKGKVDGIKGDVDLNICFKQY